MDVAGEISQDFLRAAEWALAIEALSHPLTGLPRQFDIPRCCPGPWASDAIRIRKPNVVFLIQTKYGRLPHHRHSYGRPLASGRGRSLWVRSRLRWLRLLEWWDPCHELSHCLCGVWLRGCCVLFSQLIASDGRFAVRIRAPRRRSQDLLRADLSHAVRAPRPIGPGAFGDVCAQWP